MTKTQLPSSLLKVLFLLQLILLSAADSSLLAKTRIVHSSSKTISIRDGEIYKKSYWTLDPSAHTDTYTADRSLKKKWVSFITDCDSIRILVNSKTCFDFVIVLNKKDSCCTRLLGYDYVKTNYYQESAAYDSIPFVLNQDESIEMLAKTDSGETFKVHFDLSTIGFRMKPAKAQVLLRNKKGNFTLGSIYFQNLPVETAIESAKNMDARFGYSLFEGKCIAIDLSNNMLRIYKQLPQKSKDYHKNKLVFIESLPCLKATIQVQEKQTESLFLIDNGSNISLALNNSYANELCASTNPNMPGSTTLKDGSGNLYESRDITVARFHIADFELKTIPAKVIHNSGAELQTINYLGNPILKRFDCIIDLKKDEIYLKPNKYFYEPFN